MKVAQVDDVHSNQGFYPTRQLSKCYSNTPDPHLTRQYEIHEIFLAEL